MTASYKITFHRDVEKDLRKLPKKQILAILEAINALAANPLPQGVKKLTGTDAYRIRIANYRVIYKIEDQELIVFVLKVAHRKDVYR
jgi:mRNA interferase RelE/StbE